MPDWKYQHEFQTMPNKFAQPEGIRDTIINGSVYKAIEKVNTGHSSSGDLPNSRSNHGNIVGLLASITLAIFV